MKTIKLLSLIAFAALFIIACGDKEDDAVTYTNTISNDLQTCAVAGCHASGFGFGSYANYEDTKVSIGFGRILGALRHEAGFSPMPKFGEQWEESKVQRLQDWINAGMPE